MRTRQAKLWEDQKQHVRLQYQRSKCNNDVRLALVKQEKYFFNTESRYGNNSWIRDYFWGYLFLVICSLIEMFLCDFMCSGSSLCDGPPVAWCDSQHHEGNMGPCWRSLWLHAAVWTTYRRWTPEWKGGIKTKNTEYWWYITAAFNCAKWLWFYKWNVFICSSSYLMPWHSWNFKLWTLILNTLSLFMSCMEMKPATPWQPRKLHVSSSDRDAWNFQLLFLWSPSFWAFIHPTF